MPSLDEELKSNQSWVEKWEQLESRVEKIILSQPQDESERGIQKRKLLENLLNYAASETRSARSAGSDFSRKTFNIPQSLLDELEELGFDTLKILNGVLDQFSYLFTDKKRKRVKRNKNDFKNI